MGPRRMFTKIHPQITPISKAEEGGQVQSSSRKYHFQSPKARSQKHPDFAC